MTDAATATNLDDFLGYESREKSNFANLGNWKKRDSKSINVCLHTRAIIVPLWQHQIPRIVTREKDGETRREAWGGTWNCHEPLAILKKMHKRDRDTGERDLPPTLCPLCILIEYIRQRVHAGDLKFCEKLFRWVGDDEEKAKVVYAAGLFNGYGAKSVTKAQKAAMKKAGVSPKHGWKENANSKCNYVFTVVDIDNLDDGVQVTTETTSVGDKTKEVIRDTRESLGLDEGNPLLNPYVIRWKHQPDEQEFNKKYKVTRIEKIEITSEIEKLIIATDPPDISRTIAPGNIAKLRADLEAHCLIDIPWDDIFGPIERHLDIDSTAVDEDGDDDEGDDTPESGDQSSKGGDATDKEVDDDGVELFECERCEKGIRADEFTCPHCGAEYDEESGELLPEKKKEEPKKKRRRPKKTSTAAPKERAPTSKGSNNDWPDDDDIPF